MAWRSICISITKQENREIMHLKSSFLRYHKWALDRGTTPPKPILIQFTNFFIILALLSISVYTLLLTISKVETFVKDVRDDKTSEDIYRLVKTYLQGHYDQSPALTKAEVFSMSGIRDLQGFEQSIWPKLEQIRERDGALAKNEQIIKHRLQSVWRLKKYQ